MAAHAKRPRIPRWTVALPLALLLAAGGAEAWGSDAWASSSAAAGASWEESRGDTSDAADPETTTASPAEDTGTTTAEAADDATKEASDDDASGSDSSDASDTPSASETPSTPGTSTSTNTANGVTARFVITDTGSSMTIDGTATGLEAGSTYVSLIYPANNCSNAIPATGSTTAGETQAATWENHGDGDATLSASYQGAAYRAVRGKIGSESVREITAIAPSDGTDFSATYAAIDCVPITPRR